MFGSSARIRDLERRIGELEQQNGSLREQLAAAETRYQACRHESEQAASRTAEFQRLFAALHSYRDSLGESQQTLALLANRLRDEKQETVRAGGLAAESNAAVQGISGELTRLADDDVHAQREDQHKPAKQASPAARWIWLSRHAEEGN